MRPRRVSSGLRVAAVPLLVLLAVALAAAGCGEESPAAETGSTVPQAQDTTGVDLSGVEVEMRQEPG